jgi:hypothetical protein
MEPLLSGIPQFIVASVNFLITTAQARYVIRLDELFRDQKIPVICRTKLNWWFLLTGWWTLTVCSLFVVGRIVLSGFISVKQFPWVFGPFDLLIVILMGLGYVFLAIVAALAWSWQPWRKKDADSQSDSAGSSCFLPPRE